MVWAQGFSVVSRGDLLLRLREPTSARATLAGDFNNQPQRGVLARGVWWDRVIRDVSAHVLLGPGAIWASAAGCACADDSYPGHVLRVDRSAGENGNAFHRTIDRARTSRICLRAPTSGGAVPFRDSFVHLREWLLERIGRLAPLTGLSERRDGMLVQCISLL